jgi:hypothetical protein
MSAQNLTQHQTAAGPLRILNINFDEVYQRHLGRHSQFGINVLHLIAVYGVYFCIFSVARFAVIAGLPQLSQPELTVILFGLSVPWLAVLLWNVRMGALLLSVLSASLLSLAAALLPLPLWLAIPLLPAWHQLQQLSHRWYTTHRDMARFAVGYPKGAKLVIMLAVFELPILLHYFIVGDCVPETQS